MLEHVRNNNKQAVEKYLHEKKTQSPQELEKVLNKVINQDTQWRVLHIAALKGRTEALKVLLKYTPLKDIDPEEFQKRTPLWIAVLNGHLDCALELLRAGADVNHVDLLNANLLYWCLTSPEKANIELAKFVLKYGINCRHADRGGDTPLRLICCRKFGEEWWTLLLDHGAGICCDFTGMMHYVNADFLKKITKNKVVIGSKSPVDLHDAITNCKQMELAIESGIFFNFKALLKTVRTLSPEEQAACMSFFVPAVVPIAVASPPQTNGQSTSKPESPLIKEFKRLKRLQLAKQGHSRIKPLRSLSIKYVVQHILLKENPDAETLKRQQSVYTCLPTDLVDDISIERIKIIKKPK